MLCRAMSNGNNEEKAVVNSVPAVIHWDDLPGEKTGDEIIGEAIMYEDGTTTMIVFSDASEEAKDLLYRFDREMYSIAEEGTDGLPEQG